MTSFIITSWYYNGTFKAFSYSCQISTVVPLTKKKSNFPFYIEEYKNLC